MSKYDFRYFPDRPFVLEVEDDRIQRMIEQNPDLDERTIRTVVDAINWDAISDPIGTVRVRPDGKALAVRGRRVDQPWELVFLDTNSESPWNCHKWIEYSEFNKNRFPHGS